MPKPNSNETSDLLEWVETAIARMDSDLYITRVVGVISSKWHTDKNGGHFTFATCSTTDESVFIHESSFANDLSFSDFVEGKSISFELQERDGKYSGRKVAGPRYKGPRDFDEESAKEMAGKIRKRLYFPVIQVWRDGRSIGDKGCPKEFFAAMKEKSKYLSALLQDGSVPGAIKNEIRFLLSCMHRDAADECVQWVTEQVEKNDIRDKRAVGFALGDISGQWQKAVLSKLIANPSNAALSVFAYAIWRESGVVEKFSVLELKTILTALSERLEKIISAPARDSREGKWRQAATETLELLLGLLRTRASSNTEIKMLLQPHQKITKELAKQVERVTKIVAQSNIRIFSRVQINIQKPAGDRTPDLLYALRLYLTGDDGANAIHISSVSDSENE